jgi:ribosomal protein S18 acetylase RimI-like enzyme
MHPPRTITHATINDLDRIFEIFTFCKILMETEKIYQWNDAYPTVEIIAQDIQEEHVYCIKEGDNIIGVITVNTIQDDRYTQLDWMDKGGKVLVIHRLAVDPLHQNQGVGRKLIDFAESIAIDAGFTSIRLDAYSDNIRVLKIYEQRGYQKRGEIMFPKRILPFNCYEKLIK